MRPLEAKNDTPNDPRTTIGLPIPERRVRLEVLAVHDGPQADRLLYLVSITLCFLLGGIFAG